jgi:predicted small secreted protein
MLDGWRHIRSILGMISTRRSLVVASALLLACPAESGIGDDASSAGPDDPCVPGQSLACTCAGGAPGAQVCEPDGIGYSGCLCEGDDATSADDGTPDDDGQNDGDTDDGDTDDEAPNDGPGESDDGESTAGAGVPSWTKDIVPILQDSCGAGIDGCHSRVAYNAELEKGCLNWVSYENVPLGAEFYSGENVGAPTGCPDLPLYERIVDRSPWQCGAFFNMPTAILIKPFDPDGSYTIQKIEGVSCDEGTTMPPPESGIQISQEDVDTLREWIAAGAPNDG